LAVSKKLMPYSSAASIIACASASLVNGPKFIVPRHSRETERPDRPRWVYCIVRDSVPVTSAPASRQLTRGTERAGRIRACVTALAPAQSATWSAHQYKTTLCSPSGSRGRAGAADTPRALGRGLSRVASDSAGLAPQAGCGKVRHEQTARAWPPASNPQHRPPRRSPGKRESALGPPPDPRRADQARRHNRAVHRLRDPARSGHRPRAARARPGGSSCTLRRPGSSRLTSCMLTPCSVGCRRAG
jgi:hypothetical protein